MKQLAKIAQARRLSSLAIVVPLAFGMVGALASTADAFTITGRVTNAYTTQAGPAGQGVGNVVILAINREQNASEDPPVAITKSADATTPVDDPSVGTYTLSDLPDGNYFIFALNGSEPRRIYRQPITGRNPVPVRNSSGAIDTRTLNFRAYNFDSTKPPAATLTLTNPAEGSAGTPIAPPTVISGTARDQGDTITDVNGNTIENFRAGIGQVIVALGRNIQNTDAGELPTELFNFVTRTWETIDPADIVASGGFTPANFMLVRFTLPATRKLDPSDIWSVELTRDDDNNPATPRVPITDVNGDPLFAAGERYAIGYGTIDKAGNSQAKLTIFTIQGQ